MSQARRTRIRLNTMESMYLERLFQEEQDCIALMEGDYVANERELVVSGFSISEDPDHNLIRFVRPEA